MDLAPGRRAHPTQTRPAPGSNRPNPRDSHPHGSAEGSETSEPTCSVRPVFPNLAAPVPDRPPGTKNRRPAPRYDVGKTVKRPETLKAIGRPGRSW